MPNRYMHLLDGKPAYFDGGLLRIIEPGATVTAEMLEAMIHDLEQNQEKDRVKAIGSGLPKSEYGYLRIKF
jgi:hypothetical protein